MIKMEGTMRKEGKVLQYKNLSKKSRDIDVFTKEINKWMKDNFIGDIYKIDYNETYNYGIYDIKCILWYWVKTAIKTKKKVEEQPFRKLDKLEEKDGKEMS